MADYWKSQAKKYCDFCKCWLADNRPSIDFHENGRKHKENVAKTLRAIGRKSRKEEKESNKMDQALKKMESAAMEAYRKDIEGNACADWSSKSISETLTQNNLEISSKKNWYESKDKDGKIFYWNIETNERLTEPPSCGFLTQAQQQAEAFKTGKEQLEAVQSYRSQTDQLKLEENKQRKEEERAAAEREKMKARRTVKEETEEPVYSGPIIEESTGPYGRWRTIETVQSKSIDLQLPKQEEYIPVVVPAPEPPQKVFKEKIVKAIEPEDGGGPVGFKKRKFGGNNKRNTRQRLNDD